MPGAVVLGVAVLGLVVLGVVVLGVVVLGAEMLGAEMLGAVVPGVRREGVALGVAMKVVGAVGPVRPGENEGGVVGGEPDPQADTVAGASMARAAPPRTVPRKRRRS
jgi:hypothetical protein